RLAEHDGELLHWFYDQGLVPGQEIVVRTSEPAADQFTVGLNGGERAISEKGAGGVFVKPAYSGSPPRARSAAASSTRSTAVWPSSHAASSDIPAASSISGAYPSVSR